MDKNTIQRINALAHKQKTEGLTEAEKAEQATLRRAYIDAVKANLTSQLEHTYIVDGQGRKTKLKKK